MAKITPITAIGLSCRASAKFISKGAINLPLWPNSYANPNAVDCMC